MNSITPRKSKSDRFNYKAAYDLCHQYGRISVVNADSCNEPFFQQAPQRFDDDDAHRGIDYNVTAVCRVLKERLPDLPAELTALHKVIGHPHRELYLNDWTVLSLNTLCGQAELLRASGQDRVLDFAILPLGMGHLTVAAMDPEDSRVFFRHDGGSNGYERDDHFNLIKRYTPEDRDKYPFTHWVDVVTADDETDVRPEYMLISSQK